MSAPNVIHILALRMPYRMVAQRTVEAGHISSLTGVEVRIGHALGAEGMET